jgi:hypothetical protein
VQNEMFKFEIKSVTASVGIPLERSDSPNPGRNFESQLKMMLQVQNEMFGFQFEIDSETAFVDRTLER